MKKTFTEGVQRVVGSVLRVKFRDTFLKLTTVYAMLNPSDIQDANMVGDILINIDKALMIKALSSLTAPSFDALSLFLINLCSLLKSLGKCSVSQYYHII